LNNILCGRGDLIKIINDYEVGPIEMMKKSKKSRTLPYSNNYYHRKETGKERLKKTLLNQEASRKNLIISARRASIRLIAQYFQNSNPNSEIPTDPVPLSFPNMPAPQTDYNTQKTSSGFYSCRFSLFISFVCSKKKTKQFLFFNDERFFKK
jgi:hypothetical protein